MKKRTYKYYGLHTELVKECRDNLEHVNEFLAGLNSNWRLETCGGDVSLYALLDLTIPEMVLLKIQIFVYNVLNKSKLRLERFKKTES